MTKGFFIFKELLFCLIVLVFSNKLINDSNITFEVGKE